MAEISKSDDVASKAHGIEMIEQTEEAKKQVTVDTVHNDEALKVIANYDGPQDWTEEEERVVRRMIDKRLLWILCLTYGLQYYDKAMLSQAALFGLRTDLTLTGDRYPFSASIFYLGFIGGSYPAVWLVQHYAIEKVAAGIVAIWGLCLALTATCHNYQALYAQRFFLGFLEAGISPMFMLIVGQFYKKNEQAFRIGIWFCWTGYVSIFSPLINYGIGHIKGKLAPWQYMYILAGVITVLWAFVIYFLLPPDPIRAKGFTDRQRYIAVARLQANNSGVRNTHFKLSQAIECLLDVKFWLAFAISFLSFIANGPVSTFTPIIISNFGFDVFKSLLLIMPMGAISGTLQLIVPYFAYKFNHIRVWLVIATEILTILGALLLWLLPRKGALGGLLFGCYILPAFAGGYPVLMSLTLANTAGYTKRSVSSSGIFIGYCAGNFVGPLLFKAEDAPRYAPAFLTVVITGIISIFLTLAYRLVCMWDNRQRDKTGVEEAYDHAYEDDLTDKKNPQFRYII